MRYENIPSSLFIKNRAAFVEHLLPASVAIFNANDILPTNADGTMPFKQNSDLFYLSGIDQEESILLLYPDAKDERWKEILFLKETNTEIEIWEGHKYTQEEATACSGVKTVLWLAEFEKILHVILAEADHIYWNSNEHTRALVEVETRDSRRLKWVKNKYPLHNYKRSAPIMHQLRSIKSAVEVQLIQKACDITGKAFERVLRFIRPGIKEYEIEAEYIHEFIKSGSRGFAYTPIIASGKNACVLHYIDNDQGCKAGEVLLMDVGAEYANYAADMSRAVPVSGRFTQRQKAVYNAVLQVFKAAKDMLITGNILDEYHREVGKLMEEQLIKLGLLDKTDVKNQNPQCPAYKKYFMHGTSHYLGLDVHDVGSKNTLFAPGMVFTCEPGIYIREENLGIRLENDILITENGNIDLMQKIPLEADEIEDWMNS